MGTMVAIDEINDAGGINGRELVAHAYDPASDNNLFREYARTMLVDDGLSTIFSCYSSASRRAILPIIERLNGLLWYPTLHEGFECSPNVVYTGASPNQNSVMLAKYLAANHGKRVYLVGSDYVFPRESNRIMRRLLTALGCEVVGEKYVTTHAKRHEFFPIINELKKVQPDVVFSTVIGDATTFFYQAYAQCGFDPKKMPIFSLTTTETENRAMGTDVAESHYTVASYFQAVESTSNAEFVRRAKRMYGDDMSTNACMEAAYYQVHLFKSALEMCNVMDPDVLRSAIPGLTLMAPQGVVEVDSRWAQSNVWSRVGRATRSGQFAIVSSSKDIVVTDPFLAQSQVL